MKKTNPLNLLFPNRCLVCDTVIPDNRYFCKKCEGTLKPIMVKVCNRCGCPKTKCQCKRYVYHFRGAAAPFINEDNAKAAIYHYKMLPNIAAADYFSEYMADQFLTQFPEIEIDCVTSVPTNVKKKFAACFDHTAHLAKKTAKHLKLPYKSLLFEKKKRKPQHTLNGGERFENVKNVYKAKKNNYDNVLLIDDIKTTGATLDECARQLMLAGCENVYVLTAVIST